MNTSNSLDKIGPALVKAQRAITFAVKDAKNPAFRSTYADLGSVIDACKPALNEAGIAFTQMLAPSDTGTLALTTRLIHESGEWIESTATCPMVKHDPQGYGSACTYLRRYSLASAVGLYQDDDDGNAASKALNRNGDARSHWIAERKGEIMGAKTVGELKRVMDAALAKVRENNDLDAEDQLIAASGEKVKQAKPAKPHKPADDVDEDIPF